VPVPTAYTEQQLILYMAGILDEDKAVARQLGWTTASDYDEAVVETMLAMGVDDLAGVTGLASIRLLRAVARRELWRLVAQRSVQFVDATTEGGGEEHSQLYEHARQMAEQAAAEAEEAHLLVEGETAGASRPTFFAVARGRRGAG
jgi:hypothetical protein